MQVVDAVYSGEMRDAEPLTGVVPRLDINALKGAPQPVWYQLFKYVLLGPLVWAVCRPRVVGAEHIPSQGPAIIAANHLALIDSLVLCLTIRRPVTFVAKGEYFDGAGVGGRCRRWFFTAVGQIPIDRRGGGHAEAALTSALKVLNTDGIWAIHPEGTRSLDGLVHRGHTGVMRVACDAGAPVIPVGLRGTERVNPPGSRLWRPHRVDVVIGRPLAFDPTSGIRPTTDRLMGEIAVLAGREYRDCYATRQSSPRGYSSQPGYPAE